MKDGFTAKPLALRRDQHRRSHTRQASKGILDSKQGRAEDSREPRQKTASQTIERRVHTIKLLPIPRAQIRSSAQNKIPAPIRSEVPTNSGGYSKREEGMKKQDSEHKRSGQTREPIGKARNKRRDDSATRMPTVSTRRTVPGHPHRAATTLVVATILLGGFETCETSSWSLPILFSSSSSCV